MELQPNLQEFRNSLWHKLESIYYSNPNPSSSSSPQKNKLQHWLEQLLTKKFAFTNAEAEYVFRNLDRIDESGGKKISAYQWCNFMVKHFGEYSLQKYHRVNPPKDQKCIDFGFYMQLMKKFCSMFKEKQPIQAELKKELIQQDKQAELPELSDQSKKIFQSLFNKQVHQGLLQYGNFLTLIRKNFTMKQQSYLKITNYAQYRTPTGTGSSK